MTSYIKNQWSLPDIF